MYDENQVVRNRPKSTRGVGRPRKARQGYKAVITLRCTAEQKAAMVAHVEGLADHREARGEPRLDLSTWLRDLALREIGEVE